MSNSVNDNDALYTYVLRIADNALLTAQRLGEWVGHGPQLEEEMAMANFALDFVGQARMLYSYAAEVEGQGRSEDDLAFLRDSADYYNLLLIEQPNGDFGQTIARQFYYLAFYHIQLRELEQSSDERLREIAARASKEVRYQLKHTRQWLVRLGDGTEESHQRMQAGIDEMWRYTGEFFSADEIDEWAARGGVGPLPETLREEWDDFVDAALGEATLARPDAGWMASGGKQGRHTEHHGYLLTDLQFLQRAYPGVNW